MNKIFKVVWNKARECYMVVCEYAKAQTKSCSTAKLFSSKRAAKAAAAMMVAGVMTMGVGVQSAYAEATIVQTPATGSTLLDYTITGTDGIDVTQEGANIVISGSDLQTAITGLGNTVSALQSSINGNNVHITSSGSVSETNYAFRYIERKQKPKSGKVPASPSLPTGFGSDNYTVKAYEYDGYYYYYAVRNGFDGKVVDYSEGDGGSYPVMNDITVDPNVYTTKEIYSTTTGYINDTGKTTVLTESLLKPSVGAYAATTNSPTIEGATWCKYGISKADAVNSGLKIQQVTYDSTKGVYKFTNNVSVDGFTANAGDTATTNKNYVYYLSDGNMYAMVNKNGVYEGVVHGANGEIFITAVDSNGNLASYWAAPKDTDKLLLAQSGITVKQYNDTLSALEGNDEKLARADIKKVEGSDPGTGTGVPANAVKKYTLYRNDGVNGANGTPVEGVIYDTDTTYTIGAAATSGATNSATVTLTPNSGTSSSFNIIGTADKNVMVGMSGNDIQIKAGYTTAALSNEDKTLTITEYDAEGTQKKQTVFNGGVSSVDYTFAGDTGSGKVVSGKTVSVVGDSVTTGEGDQAVTTTNIKTTFSKDGDNGKIKVELNKDIKVESVTTENVTVNKYVTEGGVTTTYTTTIEGDHIQMGDQYITEQKIQQWDQDYKLTVSDATGKEEGAPSKAQVSLKTKEYDEETDKFEVVTKGLANFVGDENITVGLDGEAENTIKVALNDNIKLGTPGQDGKDGEIGLTGKDGSSVVINGKDGISIKGEPGEDGEDGQTLVVIGKDGQDGKDGYIGVNGADGATGIGLNGKDGSIGIKGDPGRDGLPGADADITVVKGDPGVKGEAGETLTRIIYIDPENPDTEHQVATLEDGMKYKGNFGEQLKMQLNENVNVVGDLDSRYTADEQKATNFVSDHFIDGNIAVVADGEDTLTVKLNKDLDLGSTGSVTTGNTTINNNGLTVIKYKTDAAGNIIVDEDGNPVIDSTTTVTGDTVSTQNISIGGHTISYNTTKNGFDFGGVKITNIAAGVDPTDAVNMSQLTKVEQQAQAHNTVTKGNGIEVTSETKTTKDGVKYLEYKVALADTVMVGEKGEPGKDGVDGSIGVTGKDGASVVLYGKDGSIGIKGDPGRDGLPGADADITVVKGDPGVKGKDGETLTRIIYIDPEDPETEHQVATLEDGMKYSGNFGNQLEMELNKNVNIKGDLATSVKEEDLVGGNIGVVADGKDTLTIKLNKDINLGDNGSVTIGDTVIDNTGIQIGANTSLTENSLTIGGKEYITNVGINANNQKITNVAPGEAPTDAVNMSQLTEVKVLAGKHTTVGAEDTNVIVTPTNTDGQMHYDIAIKKQLDLGSEGSVTTGNTSINNNGLNFSYVSGKDDDGKDIKSTTNITVNNSGDIVLNKGTNNDPVKITNVAAGEVSKTSTDAINGSQLYATNQYIADNEEQWAKDTNTTYKFKDFEEEIDGTLMAGVKITDSDNNAPTYIAGGANISIQYNEANNLFTINADGIRPDPIIPEDAGEGIRIENNQIHANVDNKTIVINKETNQITLGKEAADNETIEINENNQIALKKEIKDQINNNTQNINNIRQDMNRMDGKINRVGARAAALAALHPLEFDPDDKLNVAAGYGNYQGENAGAVGLFYRPDDKTMFSVAGTVTNKENMVNVGVTFALDRRNGNTRSKTAMAKDIVDLRELVIAQQNQITQLTALVNKMTGNPEEAHGMFPDIPENHWAYEYVKGLAEAGVIQGYPDGMFSGDRTCTRYEFAAMLWRAMRNGAVIEERAAKEFAPELGRFRVDRIAGADNDAKKIERIRVNVAADRDSYGTQMVAAK